MNNEKIDQLKKKFLELKEIDPMSPQQIEEIEKMLGVILPNDFREIVKVFSGVTMGAYDLYDFVKSSNDYNIIDQTLNLRKGIGLPPYVKEGEILPHKYIVLYEDEVSYVFMETQDDEDKSTPIIECAWTDVNNLIIGKPLEDNPLIFPSFTDFFEWLIEKEEEDRAEEACQ